MQITYNYYKEYSYITVMGFEKTQLPRTSIYIYVYLFISLVYSIPQALTVCRGGRWECWAAMNWQAKALSKVITAKWHPVVSISTHYM